MVGKVSLVRGDDTPPYSLYQVFLTLYSEPAGDVDSRNSDATSISKGSFGEHVFSKIRRFVVIRAGEQSCTAL